MTFKSAQENFEHLVINEINQSPIEDQQGLIEALLEEVRGAIVKKIENIDQSSLKNLRSKMRSTSKSKQSKGQMEIQKEINNLFSEEEMYQHIITYLSAYGDIDNNGFSVNDIMDQVRSFRNKVILNQRASAKYYARSGKGFFREALVHEAFSQLAGALDPKIINIHAGSKKNAQGKDTIYDEYIDFFNNVETSFDKQISLNANLGFGIQSKSWIAPWEKSSGATQWSRYGIGSKKSLLDEFQNHSRSLTPINSVFFLEKKMIEAMGSRQVGFVSGRKFYWTCDLISEFRRINYYLAFVYDRKWQPTATVSWQSHAQIKF